MLSNVIQMNALSNGLSSRFTSEIKWSCFIQLSVTLSRLAQLPRHCHVIDKVITRSMYDNYAGRYMVNVLYM